MQEIIVDSFAGGGGASTGIEMALGRSPDIAINHDPEAISMHRANHPDTFHLTTNIWRVDPCAVAQGRPVGLMWASPDCKHFSKAKGGKPVKKNIRDLAWVVFGWAKKVRPRIIILENVEEFKDWGPLDEHNMPCRQRKGRDFHRFNESFRRIGYKVEHRELVAARYKGVKTTRKRLYWIARCDGLPIVWPKAECGSPDSLEVINDKLPAWGTAAQCIDWSIPTYSIFITKAGAKRIYRQTGVRLQRPLACNSQKRIATGVKRYVIEKERPFIVPVTHTGDHRVCGIDEPHRTTTCAQRGEHALVAPLIVKNFHGEKQARGADEPVSTLLTGGHEILVAAGLVNTRNGERKGQEPRVRDVEDPAPTATAKGSQGGVAVAFLAQHNTEKRDGVKAGREAGQPLSSITSTGHQQAVVVAHLCAHYGPGEGGQDRSADAEAPLRVATASPRHSVVTAFLAQHNGGMVGHAATEPVSTIVQRGCTQAVVAASMISLKGSDRRDGEVEEPAPAQCAGGTHTGVVVAALQRYFGTEQDPRIEEPLATPTTKHRDGLIEARLDLPPLTPEQLEGARRVARFLRRFHCWDGGEVVTTKDGSVIVDIGMRMLIPRELFRAQGFPDAYIIAYGVTEKGEQIPLTKTAQIRLVGNSVCPGVARALVAANYVEMAVPERGMPEAAMTAAE